MGTAQTYLQTARAGNTYTACSFSDGCNWTLLTGSSVTLNLSGSLLGDLAVISHNGKVLGTATLDTVSVSTTIRRSGEVSWLLLIATSKQLRHAT
jgi:hypothetical protein